MTNLKGFELRMEAREGSGVALSTPKHSHTRPPRTSNFIYAYLVIQITVDTHIETQKTGKLLTRYTFYIRWKVTNLKGLELRMEASEGSEVNPKPETPNPNP